VWLSEDGHAWGSPVLETELAALAACRSLQRLPFAHPVSGRYLRVHLPRAADGKPVISLARVGITTA